MSDAHKNAVSVIEHKPQSVAHPVVQALIETGDLTPESLGRIMDLQEQYERREAEKAFNMALVSLKKDLPAVIGHDARVSYKTTNYTHTTLAAAMHQVQPALTKHAFALSWRTGQTDRGDVSVTCVLSHAQGHSTETTLTGSPDNSGSKNAVQAVASTVTYLKRYTALSLLGISTADMRDVDQVRHEAPADTVDQNKTIQAVKELKKRGLLSQAIEHVGKKSDAWTLADIGKLREWMKARHEGQKRYANAEDVPPIRPGDDAYPEIGPPPMTDEEAAEYGGAA